MQGPFRGIATTLSTVFGGPVTIRSGGVDRQVRGIFRNVPGVIYAENGIEIPVVRPQLRLHLADADQVFDDDLILPGDGSTYRAVGPDDAASPASDAFVTLYLAEV